MRFPFSDPGDAQPDSAVGPPSPPESAQWTALPLLTPELLETDAPRTIAAPATTDSESGTVGWALIAMVPFDGREPPADVSDELAQATWCAVSALWHPSLLAHAAALPRVEPVESPSSP